MSVLRVHALQALADAIALAVPELAGRIGAGPCEAPKQRLWPHLNIDPVRFTYHPDQAEEHRAIGTSRVVMNVGRHEGLVQLRLGATTHIRRLELEEKVLSVFLSTAGRPGVLITEVPDYHDAVIAWELGEDEWENELAFDKKWFSIMTVQVQIPALVTRDGVYTIEDLRLTLTDDLETPIADVPATKIETVSIDDDGTITPV